MFYFWNVKKLSFLKFQPKIRQIKRQILTWNIRRILLSWIFLQKFREINSSCKIVRSLQMVSRNILQVGFAHLFITLCANFTNYFSTKVSTFRYLRHTYRLWKLFSRNILTNEVIFVFLHTCMAWKLSQLSN